MKNRENIVKPEDKIINAADEIRIARAELTGDSFPADLVDKEMGPLSGEGVIDAKRLAIEELEKEGYTKNDEGIFVKE